MWKRISLIVMSLAVLAGATGATADEASEHRRASIRGREIVWHAAKSNDAIVKSAATSDVRRVALEKAGRQLERSATDRR